MMYIVCVADINIVFGANMLNVAEDDMNINCFVS